MSRLRLLLLSLTSAALLGACAGGVWPIALASRSLPAVDRTRLGYRVYVPNLSGNAVTIYNARGIRVRTITTAIYGPAGVAVDANGKIYVANEFGGGHGRHRGPHGTVTTYTREGQQTTPSIVTGLDFPTGVAVDANGKIYVVNNGNNTLTTYLPDGTQTSPTITGLVAPTGVAVDGNGTIYVTNTDDNTLTTYLPDGTPATLTITEGLDAPTGVAVDANDKIFVANFGNYDTGSVTTYNADGTKTTPTITAGVDHASGVAVDPVGGIHVANNQGPGKKGGFGSITTYTADGIRTTPTITHGICYPVLIAVR